MHTQPRLTRSLAVAAMVVLATASSLVVAGQSPQAARTVWDGVYTDAQAMRATMLFTQACARCHTLDSSGDRPLSGEKFWEGYTQRTVTDLLTYVRTSMPNGSPGSLAPAAYNDLVALILQSNGLPSGSTELSPDTIAGVQIVPKGGSGELPANTLARVVGCLAAKKGSDWLLTNATGPERIAKSEVGAEDATRALGDRTIALKFVLTRLDGFVGQRLSVTGLTMGAGASEGINVTNVNRVSETCP